MKGRRISIIVIVAALAFTGGVTAFTPFSGRSAATDRTSREGRLAAAVSEERGQAPLPDLKSDTRRETTAGSPQSARLADAAARNAMLRTELTWSFGGKPQRGWYLYDLLLTKTLDTQSDATTAGFAAAVADWQKRRGLAANGVLDEKPLMAFVSHWQSNRLKTRTPADPSQLMTAPPADFYDPGRAAELRQVEHNTYAAYKKMIAAAMADPSLKLKSSDRFLKIISSYRSREYQHRLR